VDQRVERSRTSTEGPLQRFNRLCTWCEHTLWISSVSEERDIIRQLEMKILERTGKNKSLDYRDSRICFNHLLAVLVGRGLRLKITTLDPAPKVHCPSHRKGRWGSIRPSSENNGRSPRRTYTLVNPITTFTPSDPWPIRRYHRRSSLHSLRYRVGNEMF